MNRFVRRPSVAVAAVAALLLCSCGGGIAARADKSGSETVVLRLATIDGGIEYGRPGAQAFVDGLADVSGGRLQVEVTETYGDGAPDAESRLIEAIAAGEVDGGWPSTRAFANADIHGLEAIEAPMLITSFEAQKKLVSGPLASTALEQLEGSGVVGLGLAVLDLRRPFAVDAALLEPEDWQGIRFRSYNSPVQADTIRALGGEPVDLSFSWVDEVNAGRLRGAESGVTGEQPPLTDKVLYVTSNVVLWPKVAVLSFSQERVDALSDEQREWIRQAAELASQVSVEATYDEDTGAQAMCAQSVRFVAASPDQLAALREAVASVIDELAADPETAPLMAEVQALAADYPEPDVLDVPASCQEAAGAGASGASTIPAETSPLPDGIYRTQITLADVEAAGLNNGRGWTGTWTLTVEDGSYNLTCRILDIPEHDCGNSGGYEGPYEAGYLRGLGNTVYFVYDVAMMSELTGCELPVSAEPGHCFHAPVYSATWELAGDELIFSDLSHAWASDKIIKPWHRID